jgi:hypothetical protein
MSQHSMGQSLGQATLTTEFFILSSNVPDTRTTYTIACTAGQIRLFALTQGTQELGVPFQGQVSVVMGV